jgi:PHP family Zn ribbon phosphoesterase
MNEKYEKCWNDLKNGILLSVNELIEAKAKKHPIPDPELQLMVIQRLMYAINELEIKYGIQGKTESPIITA